MPDYIAYRADPLTHYVTITKPDGTPTNVFIQQWNNVVDYLFGSDSEFQTIDEAITTFNATEIVAGTGLSGGGFIRDETITLDLEDTTVTPGVYGSEAAIPSVTVDQQGRITAASEVAPARFFPFDPPKAADFATFIDGGSDNATFQANDLDGAGFLVRAVDQNQGSNNFGLYVRSDSGILSGNVKYEARLTLGAGAVGGTPEVGICLADSVSGKFATWGIRGRLGLVPAIVIERWTAAAAGSTLSATEFNESSYELDLYLQLQVFSNGQTTLRVSKAGKGWGFVYRWKVTDWVTPDSSGFYIRAPNLVSSLTIDAGGLIPYYNFP